MDILEKAIHDTELRKRMVTEHCECCWSDDAELGLRSLRLADRLTKFMKHFDDPEKEQGYFEGYSAAMAMVGIIINEELYGDD